MLAGIFRFLELEPVPPSEPVDPSANERYFERWRELRRSDPRLRLYLPLISLRYERRVRRYGYSLLFPERST